MRYIQKIIKKSKKFMIIKTIDLVDGSYIYGVYNKENFMDMTFGRLMCISPREVIDNLSKLEDAEKILNNLVSYHEK